MSITVNILYNGTGGNARRFAEEMEQSGTAELIRQEEGNLRYEYYVPLRDDGSVLLIDAWEDQSAIDRHHSSEMMKKVAKLREKYDLHMTVKRYTDDEMPDSESRFIRN